jgi:hypothetical protein
MSRIDFGYYKPTIDITFINKNDQTLEIRPDNTKTEECIDRQSSEEPNIYDPFSIHKLQKYIPIYSLFFEMTESNFNSIQLNHRYHIIDSNTVFDSIKKETIEKPIFIKYSPLYDPIRYMIGKYDLKDPNILNLPNIHSTVSDTPAKFLDTNNASYIDGFFNYLSSQFLNQYGFKHGVDFYGSFLGIQTKFKMNIFDDYEHLYGSTFFRNNCNRLFRLSRAEISNFLYNSNSRANKQRLLFVDDYLSEQQNALFNIETLDSEPIIDNSLEENQLTEIVYNKISDDISENISNMETMTGFIDDNRSSDSEENYSTEDESDDDSNEDCDTNDMKDTDEEDEDENSEDSESTTEDILNVYVDNFPIQMICMEKCNGTFDELFVNEKIDEKTGASALFQIVMTLLAYQKTFHFTHNDLHTNNIMYIETNEEFLYYKYKKNTYRVPTYGRIFKIIDFGRSIYKFNGKILCSDSFAPGGDAATQYNFEPYYNPNKPLLEPNYSFDLCRLGTSIFDFLFDIEDMDDYKKMDGLQKTIYRWCQDDSGKNVLYKKNGEERYPNFKLYKMIARTVHEHTPEKQLDYPFFKQFRFDKKIKELKKIMDIDSLLII